MCDEQVRDGANARAAAVMQTTTGVDLRASGAERQGGMSPRAILSVGLLLGLSAALHGVEGLGGIRPWHLLVGLAFVIALSSGGFDQLKSYRITAIDLLFVLFITANILVEVIRAPELNYSPNTLSAATDIFYFAGYMTARLVIRDRSDLAAFLKGIVLPMFPTSVVAVLQVLSIGPVMQIVLAITTSRGVEARIEDGRLIRPGAFVGHWTSLGFYLNGVLAAAMVLWALRQTGTKAASTRFIIAAVVAGVVGVLSTLTIAAIGTALVIVVVGLSVKGIRIGILLVGAAVISVFALVLSDPLEARWDLQYGEHARRMTGFFESLIPNTMLYRINIWVTETLPAIAESPWLGWGIGVYQLDNPNRIYPSTVHWASAESQWLASLMWGGAVAAVPFFVLLAVTFVVLVRQLTGRLGPLVRPIVVLYVFTIISAFTAPVFSARGLAPVLWPMIGAIVSLTLVVRDSERVRSKSAQSTRSDS